MGLGQLNPEIQCLTLCRRGELCTIEVEAVHLWKPKRIEMRIQNGRSDDFGSVG